MKRLPILIAVLLAIGLVTQHRAIHDWFSLHGYDAPASVVQLADQTTLTPGARRVFYINHPAIEDRAAFNTECSNNGEQTIVLGCYHPVDRGIFVFHVSDDRLNGVDQVTAAHEMLHAAYDRLSSNKRGQVDAWLQDYYAHDLKDDRIKAIIAAYQKTEPNDVVNEMHSVFGTEASNLPPQLENYYKQYFSNRATVVAYANSYQAEFTSRQNQVTVDDASLQSMKQQIQDNSTRLDQQETQISTLRRQLDSERSSGDISAYNDDVPIYNAKIDAYNELISATKALITSYNLLVNQRNEIALQVTDLAHSIDSNFQPITQTISQ